ncbi:hypothetical protein BDB00DRAFT_229060 [Zychaea mexicana]|uniref:uncharacterized protein n=1 Tax=Zychaea mexicana TaxID=64656 RepID=UPI0022FDF211|nr:uncharacterized protein BDB00DRAFT_229060 [Zychaea mexicana]KAI9499317.1 hypothetical protein BDB00DRAFT_229060 [Zychaea mexicana]
MGRQSIEFFLHPPSPPRPEEPCVVLPPISSLLRDAPLSPPPPSAPSTKEAPHYHHHPPPQINEPSFPPVASVDLVEPLPALTLSIPSTSSAYSSPATSPYPLDTPQSSPISSPHPGLLLPPPCSTRRSRSLSNASNASTSSSVSAASTFSLPASACSSRRLSDPPLYSLIDHHQHQHQLQQQQQQQEEHHFYNHHQNQEPQGHHHHRHDAPSTSWQRPKSASPSLPAASCPPPFVAKRKRGRPPNASRQVSQRDCWTFVTPTVWEVKQHQQQHMTDKDNSSDSDSNSFCNHAAAAAAASPSSISSANTSDSNMTVLLWPEEPRRNKGLNTFTSTRMDSTLSIPKKKRGRKPKVQLAGNSCFVWRDLTARRGANRKHRANTSSTTSAAASTTPAMGDEDRLAHRVESIKLNPATPTSPS